jgi:hypothetical protein
MDDQGSRQMQHAHPINPAVRSSQYFEPTGSSSQQRGDLSRPHWPDVTPDQLQNVLPQLNELAQKIGGMKRLAELTRALAEAKE